MTSQLAGTVKIGDTVREGGADRRVLSIQLRGIAGPYFRLSGYDDQPGLSLTSYQLCQLKKMP